MSFALFLLLSETPANSLVSNRHDPVIMVVVAVAAAAAAAGFFAIAK